MNEHKGPLTELELQAAEIAKIAGPPRDPRPEVKKDLPSVPLEPIEPIKSVGQFHQTFLSDATMHDVQRVIVRGLLKFSLILLLIVVAVNMVVWFIAVLGVMVLSTIP